MTDKTPPVKTIALIIGVINPTKMNTPMVIIRSPDSQFKTDESPVSDRYNAPRNNAVMPRAVRKISNPKPGEPPGNVENNLCSFRLL